MSAREHNKRVKELAEAEMRAYVKPELNVSRDYGKEAKKVATPSSAKSHAVDVRALAKVLPQEARAVAKELRGDAKEISAMARRAKQAPVARAAPKQVAVPDRSPVVARAAVANPPFKEKHKITIPKAAEAEKQEPGDKLRAEVKALEKEVYAKAKAGEPVAELNNFLFKVLQPKLNLYAAEYLGSGAASEMMDEIIDEVQEIIKENAAKK